MQGLKDKNRVEIQDSIKEYFATLHTVVYLPESLEGAIKQEI